MGDFSPFIPNSLAKAYRKKGVQRLFDWQTECLSKKRLFDPTFQNLIYTAPTSAGKTLVAEVIAACNVLKTGRRALFVFPYISNAREKLFDLQSLWRSAHLIVKAFIGASSASLHGWSAAVCTIEKANTLINAFIENGMLSEIGAIVIDELHMLFDSERGAIIENMLSKILYAADYKGIPIQIIGMSATLEEHLQLARWLRADYFVSSFRPLNLREFVVIEGAVFDMVARCKDRVLSEEFRINSDVKNIIGMTVESVLDEKAVLIFCSTKAETEKYAMMLARYVRYCSSKGPSGRFYRMTEFLIPTEQRQIVEYFAQKTFCTDGDLLSVISTGIAFHHAGLTVEEREEIEFLFRNGSLKILVSTSTLSSGVNLPAHRVLIMTSATSHIPLNSVTYRQMVGRAGRQGQHVVEGESYVLCSKTDWPIIQSQIERRQVSCPVRPMTRIILEAVSSEFVSSYEQLQCLLSYQFSTAQDGVDLELARLDDLKLIACVESDDSRGDGVTEADALQKTMRILPTQLGRAVLASSLPPNIATQIFADLENASRSVCLDSELHMLFLVTPINNLAINANAIDWNFYHQAWAELPEALARVSRRVGVTEKFFMQKLSGRMFARNDEALNLHIRFFATLVLYELINENPLEKVSRKFCINRGLLQSLQQQAATYAYMVVSFCDRLGWYYLKVLLEGFAERMQFGVRRDLTELVRVPGIDAIRARHFHQNGIKSLVILANAPVEEICRILRKAVPFASNSNSDQNKNTWLVGEPPLEDVCAAQLLVERALDVLKEKLEFAAFPASLFNKAMLDVTTASATSAASHWLSDDNDLTVSELLHQSAMKELCETLSPLQLESPARKENFHRPNLDVSVEERIEITNTERNNNENVISATQLPNVDLNRRQVDEESFTVDDLPTANRENINSAIAKKMRCGRSKSRETNTNSVVPSTSRKNAKSPTSARRQRGRPPKTTIIENAAKKTDNNDAEGLSLKIQLKSLDCAQILVDGRPVKLTPSRKGAQKKTWAERISKGLTPTIGAENSPLQKRRSPLFTLNASDRSAENNSVELVGSVVDADQSKGNDNMNLPNDSADAFLVESASNETMIFGKGNTSHLNTQSSFIIDADVFAAAATTSTPMPPRISIDDGEIAQISSGNNSSADLENRRKGEGLNESIQSSVASGERMDVIKLCTNLVEICNNTVLNSSHDSIMSRESQAHHMSEKKNSLYNEDDDSLIAAGIAQLNGNDDDIGDSRETAEKENLNESDFYHGVNEAHSEAVSDEFPALRIQDSITLRRPLTMRNKQIVDKDDYRIDRLNDEDNSDKSAELVYHEHNVGAISRFTANALSTSETDVLNPFAKSIENRPPVALNKINKEPLMTPKRRQSNVIVLESVRSPAINKNEDGIQMVCSCNWPPRGLFACDDNDGGAARRVSCVSLMSEDQNEKTQSRVALSSCGLSLTNGGNEVLIFVPTTRRCYLLPLKRIAGSCSKCKVHDLESLLRDFLVDDTITKWMPDALVFLRGIRRVFLNSANDDDQSSSKRLSEDRRSKRSPSTPKSAQKYDAIYYAPSCRPRNIGCVCTMDALDVNGAGEVDDAIAKCSKENSPTRAETRDTNVGTPNSKNAAIRQIAKRLGVTRWQPRWNASSRARFSPSFASRAMSAAIDAHLAHAIAFCMAKRADARQHVLQHLYLDSLESIASVELAGMAFHWQRATKMVAAIVAQMTDAERRIFRMCGGLKFNIDSPGEVANVLFVKLNLPAPQNATNTRRHLSTNNVVLRQIDHPVARAIMQWRKLQHAHSALRGLLQEAAVQANPDSRLRTCFDNFSAMAGRISSAEPNLQILPKEMLIAGKYSARSVFVAPPGMILMAADYRQLELRVLCELSQDRALARLLSSSTTLSSSHSETDKFSAFSSDEATQDPFELIARQFRSFQAQNASKSARQLSTTRAEFSSNLTSSSAVSHSTGEENISEFDCDRQKAKQLCYAIIYGMGAETLAREMHVSRADAQTLINRFFELFPKVKYWIERRSDQCKERAYCETFLGRRRAFCVLAAAGEHFGEERRQSRQAINYIVQGTASEIFRQALVNVDQMLQEEFPESQSIATPRIVMQMHDEIIIEVAEVQADKCACVLRSAMENVFTERGFCLPFPVKLSCGKSWGSLTPFN